MGVKPPMLKLRLGLRSTFESNLGFPQTVHQGESQIPEILEITEL